MNCMKCGRETLEENVFCQDCLTEMEKYPVRPDTVVLLPRRREPSLIKKLPKRHVPTPEEQITVLRKCVMYLSIILVICITAIVLMFNPTMHYIMDEHYEIGQNYSSVTTTVNTTAPSSAE